MKPRFLLFLTAIFSLFQMAHASESLLPEQRIAYQKAVELQRTGHWDKYHQLLPQLKGYPLTLYLEYKELTHSLHKQKPETVSHFIAQYADSPLANRLERQYLYVLARQKQWQTFLDFYPEEPKSTTLRCYYYQAKYETGEKDAAMKGAADLWMYGNSRPSACNSLFDTYSSSGLITEALIWQRMELSFAARKYALMAYLQKMLPANDKKDGELFLKTYRKPHELLNFGLYSEQRDRIKNIVISGIKRLGKKDLSQARIAWKHYSKWLTFNNLQRRTVELALIDRAFRSNDHSDLSWADSRLEKWQDPRLVEWRIRIALKELDWKGVSEWIYRLPQDKQEKDLWSYWQARATQELGQDILAQESYLKLSTMRSFYGFLAADRLQLPYQLNERRVAEIAPPKSLATLPAFIRIEELQYLGFDQKAKSEWIALIANREEDELLELGQLAIDRNWSYFGVLATIEAQAWDLLSMRFPRTQLAHFSQFADERQVELSYLYAIARQESALNPKAESPVGARGLMQLMPATAKETARKIGFPYANQSQLLDPEMNIRLGSAYIDQLLEKYDGNRLLATAAYNAGPHRVKRWTKNDKKVGLPADVWVETIPFRETRGYVKNVLSYNLIYGHFLGNDENAMLFETKEQSLIY